VIATAIITAPRPRPTLHQSVQSWRDAGFVGTLMIFDDNSNPVVESFINAAAYRRNTKVLGNLRNWVLALETLVSETDAKWLMVCEDDITWAKGSAAALSHDLELFEKAATYSRAGALSLDCPVRVSNDLERRRGAPLRPGWYLLNHGMKTWGAQCLVFERSRAVDLLKSDSLQHFINTPRWTKNVDAIVAECLLNAKLDIAYRIPCLVDHDLGDANSSLGYKDDRPALKTRYFTGCP